MLSIWWQGGILIAGWVCASLGQVQTTGRYDTLARQVYFGKRADSGTSDSIKVLLPFHNTTKLAAEDLSVKSHTGPLKFAQAISVDLDWTKDGVWETDLFNGIRIWSLLVQSKTAKSLSVIFDRFMLPKEGELYMMNDNEVLGAFTAAMNNKADGKFAIRPLPGDTAFLVYLEPLTAAKSAAVQTPPLHIRYISHGFRDVFHPLSSTKALSGTCEMDVRCVNSWNNQKRAVVVFMTDQMQKFCSGVMLNNAANNGRQLLLTANHCVFTDLSNAIAGFNYERLGCGSGAISQPLTAQGMKLLSRWDKSDFALFEVQEKIPASYNVYLSGWDARVLAAQNVAGVHHPGGDVKKISLYSGQLGRGSWSEGPSNFHWIVNGWSRGVTEPGSSGSPLFNSAGQAVGQLHGGASACDNQSGVDLYGGLAFSFDAAPGTSNQLKPFLVGAGSSTRQLNGRELHIPSNPVPTATSSAHVTATSPVSACPSMVCMPRDLMERLLVKLDLLDTSPFDGADA